MKPPQDAALPPSGKQHEQLQSRADNYHAFVQLLQQGQRHIDIFTHQLDRRLYDTAEVNTLLQQLIRRNRQARLRLLLRDPRYLISHGHRIVELSRQLSSYIEIRQLAEQFDEHYECFSLFDHCGILYRPHAEHFEGWFSLHEPLRVKSERVFFEEAWAASPPCRETRRLYL